MADGAEDWTFAKLWFELHVEGRAEKVEAVVDVQIRGDVYEALLRGRQVTLRNFRVIGES